MTLPAEANEVAALDLAHQRVREYRDAGAFRRDAGHAVLRGEMKTFALSSVFNLATVKDFARRGWDDAQLALDELAATYIGGGENLPPQLADHVIDRLHPSLPRIRGRKKAGHILRDITCIALVSEISQRFGLKPRRNRAPSNRPTERLSACGVVAQALQNELPAGSSKVTERALEQIWERLGPWVFKQEAKMLTQVGIDRT